MSKIKKHDRKYNFSSGPTQIPLAVLDQINRDLYNYNNSGMSIMEMSHRSKYFYQVQNTAIQLLRELYSIPDEYEVLFLQGGARLQFSMIPLNYNYLGKIGYVNTGPWALDAYIEAEKVNKKKCYIIKESQDKIPKVEKSDLLNETKFLHITSNNTINGIQYTEYPKINEVTLIADMTSDILSKKINVNDFGIIYASAQKNLGISGVTIVIIKKSLLENCNPDLPPSLKHYHHFQNDCMLATSPTFSIYVLKLILEFAKKIGGLEIIEKNNEIKAKMIYDIIDNSNGFYTGFADKGSRSIMNITFELPTEDLNRKFILEAEKENIINIGGHHKRGGIRISNYNWIDKNDCQVLCDFMKSFMNR